MKKITYTTPQVEITKWNSQDIITTSGETLSLNTTDVSTVGDTNVTAKVSYNSILEN